MAASRQIMGDAWIHRSASKPRRPHPRRALPHPHALRSLQQATALNASGLPSWRPLRRQVILRSADVPGVRQIAAHAHRKNGPVHIDLWRSPTGTLATRRCLAGCDANRLHLHNRLLPIWLPSAPHEGLRHARQWTARAVCVESRAHFNQL